MASKAVRSVAKYVGSYARNMAERHEQLMQREFKDQNLLSRFHRAMQATVYYRKIGLVDDDMLYETYRDHVREGIQRLPREEQEARVFRQLVAAHLDAKHEILPESERITKDTNRRYAKLYVDDVVDEMHAKLYWKHQ